ncbi:tRNA ligase [Cryptococcus neoformans]|uniref:tRNA ligase n=1 Tax=Cryptococcus neoformans Tu259-1 TaxID=1230072 RepID=A0A854QKV4_CRYNE|nr:tRNA ligase [Cryptococcus neoformans var. grubii AD1-83a]OXG22543.1 tRNA ligase [Cryptococcus neoformans var. grubii Tu259-1]OXG33731.1 tRNA ligase [Cryptococcus neoformans var. grubii Bt15]OXG42884.1 tRNA ligase [Cryptococcus neoformans var. grubii Bt120]OXG50910.1 tRNA ligase [Cryptococcus neoformans var. grubii Th84]OXG60841.1 tRNA ligase [Cryptococcus neoformans var. grubii MW-RSA1955]OXG64671.1 tRNA ligase [Cryptococcus neoformans var. grubii c8]OXG65935.1 tRNA ligase [Cryptococcus n
MPPTPPPPQPSTYASKHPESTPRLLNALRDLHATDPKAIRTTVHRYPAALYAHGQDDHARDRFITSWKMTEHMYFKKSLVFPTLARGLFTEEVLEGDPMPPLETCSHQSESNPDAPNERIVLRGYDKFFNIGEVSWTEWDAMKQHTQGPYYLTLKSNGCLILISALSPTHLIVASKHSLGTTTAAEGVDLSGTEKLIDKEKPAQKCENSALEPKISQIRPIPSFPPTVKPLDEPFKNLTLEQSQASQSLSKNALKKAEKAALKYVQKMMNEGKSEGSSQSTTAEEKKEIKEHEEAQQHAEVGRRWLKRTLESSGKTEEELARKLWEKNLTAVLELCDDSFEEHVIATPEHWTGLHLHGLNSNTPHFSTSSPSDVAAFAKEFGFIQTKYIQLESLEQVRSFTADLAQSGTWEGEMIEGFVVRCTVKSGQDGMSQGAPPYHANSPFFFKVKFEEPYLLYRQFREITRVMLPLLENTDSQKREEIWKKVRSRAKRPEVKVYSTWVGEMMKKEPELFEDYNRGVIRVRERFLKWAEEDGKKMWDDARAGKVDKEQRTGNRDGLPKKWIVVPAAIPGCGKTLLGVALSKVFGLAHTQSDDITTKRTAPTFIKNVTDLLVTHDVVFADRCNHIPKHYDELAKIAEDKKLQKFDTRLICVTWDLDTFPYYRLLRILSDRVVARGENHQTLRPDPTLDAEHEAVVGKFIRDYTPPDPAIFSDIISVNVMDSAKVTLTKVVQGLVKSLGLTMPSEDAINQGLEAASLYKTTTPYHPAARHGKSTRYFAVAPEINLYELTSKAIEPFRDTEKGQSAWSFLDELYKRGRITARPHVTLSHENNVKVEKEEARSRTGAPENKDDSELVRSPRPGPEEILWETCKSIATSKYPPLYSFSLTHLVWDDRTMAFCISSLSPVISSTPDEPDGAASLSVCPDLDSVLPQATRTYLHVTVGTRDADVPAFESRSLVKVVRERLEAGEQEGEIEELVANGGSVKWIKVGPARSEGRIRGMA